MTATGALPKPRGRWQTIFLSGVLAFAITVALQPLFVLALVQVRSHTDLDAVRNHLREAFDQGILAADERPRLSIHRGGHQFTECIAHVVSLDSQTDVARTAIFPTVHDDYRFRNPCEELQKLANGAPPAATTDYARYWHGYRIYLWPLLEHFSLGTVRLINALLILAAAAVCYVGFRGVIGATPAAVFIIVLLSLTDLWLAWRISTHAISLVFILLGVAGFGLLHARWRNPYLAVAVAAFYGATFNFLDILVNPPMMPMLLAFLVLAARELPDRNAPPQQLGAGWLAALVALSWFGAYALTWLTKWGLAAWYSPSPAGTWGETLAQIIARLHGHEVNHPPILSLPFYPTIRMFGKALISFGVVVVVVLAIAIYRHIRDSGTFDRRRFLILISPVLIPILWFEVVSNHTQTHLHFTYRSASAAIAIAFAAALLATRQPTTLAQLIAGLRQLRSSEAR